MQHRQHQLPLSSQKSPPPLLSLCEQLSQLEAMIAPTMNASPADMPPAAVARARSVCATMPCAESAGAMRPGCRPAVPVPVLGLLA
jgi:hypothetical protein